MEFYLDSACLEEIEDVLKRGVARGLTTNPSLVRSQVGTDPLGHLRKVVDLVESSDDSWPISVQVTTREPAEMLRQGVLIAEALSYKNLAIKIPCSWDALPVVHELSSRGIAVNCTACITTNQALLAASAGADYVSMFYGKMSDSGVDAAATLARASVLVQKHGAKLVVGSIRRPYDISEIAWSGADVATVPYPYFKRIAEHEKSEEAVATFAGNFLAFD
ncbi:transaldolase family protein [Actinoplanes philippinensis]|uniref:transaldolase family protein n=1 Tax=Actinoplanes philippinensis TaxID=35752 RepID=UPI00340FFE3F